MRLTIADLDVPREVLVQARRNEGVRVGRRGELVVVQIGGTTIKPMRWREAERVGKRMMREGALAVREKRPADTGFGHDKLECSGRECVMIGRWILQKSAEARIAAGDESVKIGKRDF